MSFFLSWISHPIKMLRAKREIESTLYKMQKLEQEIVVPESWLYEDMRGSAMVRQAALNKTGISFKFDSDVYDREMDAYLASRS